MIHPKRQEAWSIIAVIIAVTTLTVVLPSRVAAQSSGLSEDCIAFDADRAEVRRYSASWKLVFGTLWLKDFGDNEKEARRAQQIIQHYGMNKQCFVGRPDPSMEYYLAGDDAPAGPLPGEDCTSFDPDRISLVIANGRYTIIEGDNWLLDFGRNKSEALKALKLIRTYQFTHLCFVGRPDPSFTYFRTSQRSSGGGEGAGAGAAPGRKGTASSSAVRILVYGTNACGRCVSMKRSLSDENIVYTFYDINREPERKDEMFRHVNREHQGISRVSVPVVVVGEAVLINPSFAQVQQELAAAAARVASGSGPADPAKSSWEDSYYERYDHRSFFAYGPANERIRLNSIDYPLLRAALFYETNLVRVRNGRSALAHNPGCAAAAQMHAEDMAKGKFFSHENPNDASRRRPRDRVALFDVHWGWMAENINQGMGNGTYVEVARQYVDSWMHSSGHRANILNPDATHLGTGAYNAGHKLSDLYFDVVQIFAYIRE
jgi:uncharacterized protein YkwD